MVNQITEKIRIAENLTRSTSEPKIRQTVMAANVAWKATNTISYIGVALLWLWQVDGVPLRWSDWLGAALSLAGMMVIMWGSKT